MRPENIEAKKAARKRDAVRGLLLLTLVQGGCAAGLCALGALPGLPGWGRILFWIAAAGCLAILLPALIMLKKRFEEIEGGELDAAGKY